jgi:hypothetical protein
MPCIAMGAGVRPQEVDATEPIKPPIARRHEFTRRESTDIMAEILRISIEMKERSGRDC